MLAQVLIGERFAAPTLDEALSKARLSTRDAGLATHIVYGSLRYHLTLERALQPLLRSNTQNKVKALLLAGAFEKLILETPGHAVVNEYVNLAKRDFGRLSGLVNAVLRRVSAPTPSAETELSLPGWLITAFENAYGEGAEAVMRDFLQPSPLWLWLTGQGVRDLESEGAAVEPGFGDVYRVTLAKPLRASSAFVRGEAQPINPASFAAVEALGDVRGERVLDLAGGAGVKAAMLAARGAHVTSVDVDARKHKAARENLSRLRLQAEFLDADLREAPRIEGADFVLLDAPCTGSGTLRAHPEIKLRLTPQAVEEMAALQAQLLQSAASLVRPGGSLLYSVCSVMEHEGPGVLRVFLQRHPEFEASGLSIAVPSVQDKFGVRTLAVGGLDGFYLSKLRRLP
ncbi:tRNA/rRNA cytosine-C5-methylase [Deinococcus peraridilitoris DSM 19664]|uniref:tRNA/rRNA cytosine-C5-methylase n=1 Tax=Deinococcus peraridilitoris (strain DSM 19664 / LMG 22246 / CIP 109416 / KR-200) TaxID=937777 RepID=L0A5G9_DEIPD|nr:tRNA/rRNA cytosine-C5-methylase [Deinococcus peraridilitoris DSM 19664]